MDRGLDVAVPHGLKRSPRWASVRRAFTAKNPACVACNPGDKYPVQAHHIFPFHLCILLGRPDLELDSRNLITLCEDPTPGSACPDHHMMIGHLGFFKSTNPSVVPDARKTFHGLSKSDIKGLAVYRARMATRIKPWSKLTVAEKKSIREEMDRMFPKG